MSYVITQPCAESKDASCVQVCPVDCIRTGESAGQYFIDPEVCIDCGACVDTCPVEAIYPEEQVPEHYQKYVALNAAFFGTR